MCEFVCVDGEISVTLFGLIFAVVKSAMFMSGMTIVTSNFFQKYQIYGIYPSNRDVW